MFNESHQILQSWMVAGRCMPPFIETSLCKIGLYQNLKKLWTSLFVVNLSSLSITMFMCGLWCWQLLGRTSEKDEQSDEAKEVKFFVIFHQLELSSSSSSSLDSWTVLIRLLLLTSIYSPSVLPLSISY